MERERARDIEIETTETEYARKRKGQKYNVTRAAHISTQWHTLTARFSLPIHIQHHHMCSSEENNILLVAYSCRGNGPVVFHISSRHIAQLHCDQISM